MCRCFGLFDGPKGPETTPVYGCLRTRPTSVLARRFNSEAYRKLPVVGPPVGLEGTDNTPAKGQQNLKGFLQSKCAQEQGTVAKEPGNAAHAGRVNAGLQEGAAGRGNGASRGVLNFWLHPCPANASLYEHSDQMKLDQLFARMLVQTIRCARCAFPQTPQHCSIS